MPDYRRAYVPGGSFFLTVVTYWSRRIFHEELNRTLLGDVFRECQEAWPFEMHAIYYLSDEMFQEGRREPALQILI